MRKTCNVMAGNPKRRWNVSIKLIVAEIVCGVVDWFILALDRVQWKALANTVMNFQVSLDEGICTCSDSNTSNSKTAVQFMFSSVFPHNCQDSNLH
jgi:hypothetical protein